MGRHGGEQVGLRDALGPLLTQRRPVRPQVRDQLWQERLALVAGMLGASLGLAVSRVSHVALPLSSVLGFCLVMTTTSPW